MFEQRLKWRIPMTFAVILSLSSTSFLLGIETILWISLKEPIFKIMVVILVIVLIVLAFMLPHILNLEYSKRRRNK
jgi:heme/copper-type cytochrome/quinol oxidase subunit 2